MTKYFVDAAGNYIGGFDEAEPPAGAIEVPEAPADARQKWNNGWLPYNPDYAAIDQDELNRALIEDGSVLRGMAVLMLDEFNRHATKITAILDAADTASSLATFKTAMEAIADQPQRTQAQFKTALIEKMRG